MPRKSMFCLSSLPASNGIFFFKFPFSFFIAACRAMLIHKILFFICYILIAPLSAQQDKAAVQVVDISTDRVGENFVYHVREHFRSSNSFYLTSANIARLMIFIQTMPHDTDSDGLVTLYSVVWTIKPEETDEFEFPLYIDGTIGYAGADAARRAASNIVAQTDKMVEQWKAALSK